MTFQFALLPKHLLRVGIVAIATIGASACSTVPNWVDPTNWIGGSDDQTAPPDPSDQASDNGQTPDLSTIPDKPGAPSTADEQRDVAQSLQGDRTRAQYSGDALKGGTEPTAAPPPAEAAPSTEELASNDASPAAPPPAPAAALPPQSSAPGTLPSDSAPAAPTPPPQTQVAAVEMPSPAAAPSAGPAVPAAPALVPNRLAPSDTTLGFRPSNAPPLDASVAQFVPPSILARYRQTAAMGPQTAVPAADTAMASNLDTTKTRRRTHATAMGAPEAMSGAVVANFDAPAAGSAAVPPAADGILGSPAAVVYFSSDTTALSADARAQVQAAAKAFMAQGAQGYVRIIGHSSGRMGGMTASRYLVWNFERSLARANAVAKALIKAGVPADKVLVQAVEDGQSANPGDDGGRRAEIFFQS